MLESTLRAYTKNLLTLTVENLTSSTYVVAIFFHYEQDVCVVGVIRVVFINLRLDSFNGNIKMFRIASIDYLIHVYFPFLVR